MDFKNAVKALQIGKKEGKKFRLSTEFGKNPEEELPFPEYPRPQMRRENWTNLNGWWEYAFTETQKMPKQRDGKILVPFSPECDASGVKRQLLPKEYLWYFRTIQLPKIPAGKRLLLQFGAVDHLPGLLVADGGNGAGIHHIGVGLVGKFHHLMSFCPEGLLHSLRLILIYLAAKGVNGNFHRFSLRFQNRSYIMNNYAIERDFRGDSRDFPPIIRLFSE